MIPVVTELRSEVAVYVPEEAKEGAFYSIFGAVADLSLKSTDLVYTCASEACDGSHSEERACFGVEGSAVASGTLSCTVTSQTLKVKNVRYKGRSFSKLFLSEAFLGVSMKREEWEDIGGLMNVCVCGGGGGWAKYGEVRRKMGWV